MGKILIIEDEAAIADYLKDILEDAGYTVDTAGDGMEGVMLFQKNKYDLVLLDILLPKIDGYVVLELIRKESDVPVVMLTAMEQETKQVKAFDLKADDYIVKPSSAVLIIKRVEAALRRAAGSGSKVEAYGKVLSFKEIKMNTESCEVYMSGRLVPLTLLEFEILKLFLENKNRVLSRETLLNSAWGTDFFGDEKNVNVHIMNLRRKLNVGYIRTVRGMGYKISE
jgi:two-component system response regulator VanR